MYMERFSRSYKYSKPKVQVPLATSLKTRGNRVVLYEKIQKWIGHAQDLLLLVKQMYKKEAQRAESNS